MKLVYLIRYLNHCKSDNFVTDFEALLEHLGDHILAQLFVFNVHSSFSHCSV